MISAGSVHKLPVRHGPPLRDSDSHYHILLTDCPGPGSNGTLVYGTSSVAEQREGAVCCPVEARRTGVRRNGLRWSTCFYPGVLVREAHSVLQTTRTGFDAAALAAVRRLLPAALGSSSHAAAGHKSEIAASWRGLVVSMQPWFAEFFRTRHAVVLTEPRYSRKRHFQVVVPLIPGDNTETGATVLRVVNQPWIRVLGQDVGTALLPVPFVHSVKHDEAVEHATGFRLDPRSLALLERMVCRFLGVEDVLVP
jgi:hypothetical protein